MTLELKIYIEDTEAKELLSLLSYWFEYDGLLSNFILEAAREVADVADLVKRTELHYLGVPNTVVCDGCRLRSVDCAGPGHRTCRAVPPKTPDLVSNPGNRLVREGD